MIPKLSTIIIADPSRVFRDLLALILRSRSEHIIGAEDHEEALAAVARAQHPSLLIVSSSLPPHGGLALLAECDKDQVERPGSILTATHKDAEEETQAFLLGAMAYLLKPISSRDISLVLMGRDATFAPTAPRASASALTLAIVKGDRAGTEEILWEVNDLSASGALIATKGPLPEGTSVELELILGSARVSVEAIVVRNQEPSWALAGGVGVSFRRLAAGDRELLARYVEAHRPLRT